MPVVGVDLGELREVLPECPHPHPIAAHERDGGGDLLHLAQLRCLVHQHQGGQFGRRLPSPDRAKQGDEPEPQQLGMGEELVGGQHEVDGDGVAALDLFEVDG